MKGHSPQVDERLDRKTTIQKMAFVMTIFEDEASSFGQETEVHNHAVEEDHAESKEKGPKESSSNVCSRRIIFLNPPSLYSFPVV